MYRFLIFAPLLTLILISQVKLSGQLCQWSSKVQGRPCLQHSIYQFETLRSQLGVSNRYLLKTLDKNQTGYCIKMSFNLTVLHSLKTLDIRIDTDDDFGL